MIRSAVAMAATVALLGACSNPAETDNTEGPVVSSSEAPRNEAVDTSPTSADATPTPGANSFTEGQAREAIEGAGYSEIGALTQNEQGLWQAAATKDGAETQVSVDYKGTVTTQ